MNYYQAKKEESLAAAKAQIAQAVAHYEYPSQKEIEFALMEMKLLNLKQAASTVNAVINKLDKSGNNQKKSPSCGCSGNKASAGRRETKSVMKSAGDRPHYFANEMQRICREQLDREYDAFCARYL